MSSMHNPPHPGKLVKADLQALDLSVTKAAQSMGVSRKHLSSIINGSANISPDTAQRLAAYIGSTARHWLAMQNAYDLWQSRNVANDIKPAVAATVE